MGVKDPEFKKFFRGQGLTAHESVPAIPDSVVVEGIVVVIRALSAATNLAELEAVVRFPVQTLGAYIGTALRPETTVVFDGSSPVFKAAEHATRARQGLDDRYPALRAAATLFSPDGRAQFAQLAAEVGEKQAMRRIVSTRAVRNSLLDVFHAELHRARPGTLRVVGLRLRGKEYVATFGPGGVETVPVDDVLPGHPVEGEGRMVAAMVGALRAGRQSVLGITVDTDAMLQTLLARAEHPALFEGRQVLVDMMIRDTGTTLTQYFDVNAAHERVRDIGARRFVLAAVLSGCDFTPRIPGRSLGGILAVAGVLPDALEPDPEALRRLVASVVVAPRARDRAEADMAVRTALEADPGLGDCVDAHVARSLFVWRYMHWPATGEAPADFAAPWAHGYVDAPGGAQFAHPFPKATRARKAGTRGVGALARA